MGARFRCTQLLALLLLFLLSVASAGRRHPLSFPDGRPSASETAEVVTVAAEADQPKVRSEECEGFSNEDSLTKKSLSAHTDYIYTCGDTD